MCVRVRMVMSDGGKKGGKRASGRAIECDRWFPCFPQELREANETLRSLQKQLELVPSPSSSTLDVLLDTKDARIATLEREVDLLEREVERLRPSVLVPPQTAALPPLKRQVSFLLNNVQIGKDGSVLGRL